MKLTYKTCMADGLRPRPEKGFHLNRRFAAMTSCCALLFALSWAAFLPPAAFLAGTIAQGAPAAVFAASALLYFAVLICLLLVALTDYKTMEIPDALSIAIAVCGAISIFIGPDIGLKAHLLGLIAASGPLFLLALFIDGAFGLGDVKLMAAAGLFLGWQQTLAALFIAIIIGGICGVFLLAAKRKTRRDHFAFGPALCIGIGISMFAGDGLVGWYFSLSNIL